ncbi:hypothetical protein CROQUDRAFT_671545 [Cronartium quercuum f. sp. fusiforme G11]|uniref:Uncharacterized protein n=1 Tax=Cronartium quercuum f. sp. fusiforme G11 TaxID=708437 RepID=A0A9P6TBI7_9BASI|nr:hypothetical protein CROQUDRAFT_671545 [Cronartium quercuum f. sp. fusiforme G11]
MDNLTASATSAPINTIEAERSFSLEACARAPQAVKSVSRLKPDGTNFVVWKTQLALVVYIFTDSEDYLDTPITSKVDFKLDQLVFLMIFWSIDPSLQSSLTIGSSAHEAFQALKQINICDPSSTTRMCSKVKIDPETYGDSSELNYKSFQKVQPIVRTEQPKRKVLCLKADGSEDTTKFDSSPTGTGRSRLLELPLEIIERIIQRLHRKANDEVYWFQKKKWPWVLRAPHLDPLAYSIHPQAPIVLNSLQAFASTNKKIYELCRPWLWKKLEFPFTIPQQMPKWICEILPKQGHLVESLSVELSPAWLPNEPLDEDEEFLDNLIIVPENSKLPELSLTGNADGHRGLSPGNLTRLLVQCPNLKTLSLTMCDMDLEDVWPEVLEELRIRLMNIFRRIPQIQHLELKADTRNSWPGRWLNEIVDIFPLLRSFSGSGICDYTQDEEEPTPEWLGSFSRLKHLRRLELKHVDCLDRSSHLSTWPKTIINLTIDMCGDFTLPNAHEFICHFSENLTYLRLGLLVKLSDEIKNSPRLLFNLPSLNHLGLCTFEPYDLLPSFQNCDKLERIDYKIMIAKCWNSTTQLIYNRTWPKLKKINIISLGDSDDWEFVVSQEAFCDFCDEEGLKLSFDHC